MRIWALVYCDCLSFLILNIDYQRFIKEFLALSDFQFVESNEIYFLPLINIFYLLACFPLILQKYFTTLLNFHWCNFPVKYGLNLR